MVDLLTYMPRIPISVDKRQVPRLIKSTKFLTLNGRCDTYEAWNPMYFLSGHHPRYYLFSLVRSVL